MKTKISFFVFIMLSFLIISCSNNNNDTNTTKLEFESTGLIVGQDMALCACCGNWIIKIDGNQNTYQTINIPENLNLNLIDAIFPIPVRLNWHVDPNSSCGYIIIDNIERITN